MSWTTLSLRFGGGFERSSNGSRNFVGGASLAPNKNEGQALICTASLSRPNPSPSAGPFLQLTRPSFEPKGPGASGESCYSMGLVPIMDSSKSWGATEQICYGGGGGLAPIRNLLQELGWYN